MKQETKNNMGEKVRLFDSIHKVIKSEATLDGCDEFSYFDKPGVLAGDIYYRVGGGSGKGVKALEDFIRDEHHTFWWDDAKDLDELCERKHTFIHFILDVIDFLFPNLLSSEDDKNLIDYAFN